MEIWDADAEAEADADTDAAEDECERWRMERSEGLRRRSWLLVARWPGVWLRGSGGALSWTSPSSSPSSAETASGRGSVGDVAWIFCDRTTLVFGLPLVLLLGSAILSEHAPAEKEGAGSAERRAVDRLLRDCPAL